MNASKRIEHKEYPDSFRISYATVEQSNYAMKYVTNISLADIIKTTNSMFMMPYTVNKYGRS